MKLPTPKQALTYFDTYHVPKNITAHCLAVQRYSLYLAKQLQKAGMKADLELVDRLALLHDLFKAVTVDLTKVDSFHQYKANEQELAAWRELKKKYPGKHESEIAYDLLKGDFPEFAQALKNSCHPLRKKKIEELIVHYIDWRVIKEDLVSLDERFAYLQERYPQFQKLYGEGVKLIKASEKEIFSRLPFSPEELKSEEQHGQ